MARRAGSDVEQLLRGQPGRQKARQSLHLVNQLLFLTFTFISSPWPLLFLSLTVSAIYKTVAFEAAWMQAMCFCFACGLCTVSWLHIRSCVSSSVLGFHSTLSDWAQCWELWALCNPLLTTTMLIFGKRKGLMAKDPGGKIHLGRTTTQRLRFSCASRRRWFTCPVLLFLVLSCCAQQITLAFPTGVILPASLSLKCLDQDQTTTCFYLSLTQIFDTNCLLFSIYQKGRTMVLSYVTSLLQIKSWQIF